MIFIIFYILSYAYIYIYEYVYITGYKAIIFNNKKTSGYVYQ